MSKFFVVFVLMVVRSVLMKCETDTKLISTLLMFRHGDRTPFLSSLNLTSDPEAVAAASAPYGYGQLTDVGLLRCYKLGETILSRYSKLFSPTYNDSEIYIRTTEYSRTKMSVLTVMAAVYTAFSRRWSKEINWVPTPYTTAPAENDFVLFTVSCPNFINSYKEIKNSNSSRFDKYMGILNIIAKSSGQDLTSTPVVALFQLYDAYVSQLSLGIPLSPEIAELMPELKIAADEAIDILFGDDELIAFEGGVIVNEFLTQADKLISGIDTPRVRVYSAHETSVYAFEAAARVYPRQGVPAYSAFFALELRMVEETGEYVVLPVYQSHPGEPPIYLSISGCGRRLCPYDTFKQLVSRYALDEHTWRIRCGFANDLNVD